MVNASVRVVGRYSESLARCEKWSVKHRHVDDVGRRADQDIVVDCTGSPSGLSLAMRLVRPRGTIVLKSTFVDSGSLNLTPLVVNEVTLLGSRCGPFPEAINALAREAIEVQSMISKTFPIEQSVEAFEAARDPDNVKVLLKVDSR